MTDPPNPLYTPHRVRDETLRIGTFALTTLQCALVMAVYCRSTKSKAPHYQHARRTLAAWLNDEEWHRYTFKLKTLGPWHEIYEQLNAKGVMEFAGNFESEHYPPAPDYSLTDLGDAIGAMLKQIVPKPLTGKQYSEFIDRQRNMFKKVKDDPIK